MFIKDGHPLALEIEGILDDNMGKTDKAEVSTIVGDFKIMDKTNMTDVSAIVGVKGIMMMHRNTWSGLSSQSHPIPSTFPQSLLA